MNNIFLDDEDLDERLAALPRAQTYFGSTLTIFDIDGLIVPTDIDRYNTIILQLGSDIAYVRLIAGSPKEVLRLLEIIMLARIW